MPSAEQLTGSAPTQGRAWGTRARDWSENEVQQLPTYEEAIRRVGIGAGQRVLDVGCGSGVFLRLAADRGATAVGLDASEALLDVARERVPEAELRAGDMQALPFGDDEFDVVAGFSSFFFAADMVAALRDAGRVAKPGAPVVIQVWGRPDRVDLTPMLQAVRALRPPAPSTPVLAEPGVLETIASAAGLTPDTAFDIRYPMDYPDRETMLRRLLAPGPVVLTIEHAGEAAVGAAITDALERFRRADGSYGLSNEWHFLIARA